MKNIPKTHAEIVEQVAKDLNLSPKEVSGWLNRVFSASRSGVGFYADRFAEILLTGLGRIWRSGLGNRNYMKLKKEEQQRLSKEVIKYKKKNKYIIRQNRKEL
jgi:hypothetical protein